ncbi:MAG: DUF6076 domain-containing protein [Clostridia bacterium]
MKFDIVSKIYYMKMHIMDNNEYFTRDSFSTVLASYDKSNDTYTILKERDEFRTKREYNKYLSTYSNSLCKLYKSDFVNTKNELGTILLKFLNYDFTNFNSFVEFIYNYGLPGLISIGANEDINNQFNKCTNLKITNDNENIYFTEKDFLSVCKNNFEKRKKVLIDYQFQFKKIINFINNLSNLEYLKYLSISDRFYIYKHADFDNYTEMSLILSSYITLSYDIGPLKSLDIDSYRVKGNFEENAKAIAEQLKKYPEDYDNNRFLSFCFNCHVVESACFITLLELIKNNTPIYICKNCGNYFIPTSKKNTLYCNNIYEHSKTCQEIGAMITYNKKLKKDEINALYRKTLSAKKMLANRNPDIPMYLEKYEKWKKEANKFKQDIKDGKKTTEEFKKWIEETRKK